MPTTEAIVEAYLSYWKESDIEGLKTLYAPDVQYHDLTSGAIIGAEDLEQFLRQTFDLENDSEFKFNKTVYPDENSAFIHWTQRLTIKGQSRKIEVAGVELIVVKDCKISNIHEFYDYKMPAPGGEEDSSTDPHVEQLRKLGLDEERVLEIKEALLAYFEQGDAYLDPDINLTSVAEAIGATRNQASYVINNLLECSFYDLVNQYRIDYVLEIIRSADAKFSVVTVAMEAGFNSISGFYSAFKKQTGMTPTAYSKHIRSAA